MTLSIFLGKVSMACCGVFSPVTAEATFATKAAPASDSRDVGSVGDQATRAGLRLELDQPAELRRDVGHRLAHDVGLTDRGSGRSGFFFSEVVLQTQNWA